MQCPPWGGARVWPWGRGRVKGDTLLRLSWSPRGGSCPPSPTALFYTGRIGAALHVAHTRDQPGCFWGSGSCPWVCSRGRPQSPSCPQPPQVSLPFWTSVPPAPAPFCKGRQRGPQGHFGQNTWVLGCFRLHLPLTGSELSWRGGRGSKAAPDSQQSSQGSPDGGRQVPVTDGTPPPRARGTDARAADLRPQGPPAPSLVA